MQEARFEHKIVLINVNRTGADPKVDLYDSVRYSWKISPSRAEKADYVAAVIKGVIVGVFVVDDWLPDTKENFPEFSPQDRPWGMRNGRWAFRGRRAPSHVEAMYLNKQVPRELRKHGAANPIRYIGI
jgi:hypothetical protein